MNKPARLTGSAASLTSVRHLATAEDSLHSIRRAVAELLFYAQDAVDGRATAASTIVERLLANGAEALMAMNTVGNALWDVKGAS